MLVPAILYADEIRKGFQSKFYSDDMLYETGGVGNWCPDIAYNPQEGLYQYAIVDKDKKLIGFLQYTVDYYVNSVSRFGLISFDNGNIILGKDLHKKFEELCNKHRLIVWHMVGGNHVEKTYDRICKKHGGNKLIVPESIRDTNGNYHDDVIYYILNK